MLYWSVAAVENSVTPPVVAVRAPSTSLNPSSRTATRKSFRKSLAAEATQPLGALSAMTCLKSAQTAGRRRNDR